MSGRWGCAEPGSLLPSLSLQGRLVYQEIRSCVLRGEKEKIGWVVRMDVVVHCCCVEIWGWKFGVGSVWVHMVVGEILRLCLIVCVVVLCGLVSPLSHRLIKFFEL